MWQRWMSGETLGIDAPNPLINALAIAFGTYLAQRTGLEWQVIEDEHGTEDVGLEVGAHCSLPVPSESHRSR